MEKVRHLFLLVGSNPLPNAVAGKLLIEAEGKIHLIHSEDSYSIAVRLGKWLKKENKNLQVSFTEVTEAAPNSIVDGINQELENVSGLNVTVGLNYTGGTKMMSVHAYRALERWAHKTGKGIKPQFSYLDAGTLRMVFDPHEDNTFFSKSEYVGLKVNLTFEDLLILHDRKLDNKNPPNEAVILPDTISTLAKYSSKFKGFTKSWNRMMAIQSQFEKEGLSKPTETELNKALEKVDAVKTEGDKNKLKEAILKAYGKLFQEKSLSSDGNVIFYNQELFRNNKRSFTSWLTGFWLEHYVLSVLKKLKETLKLENILQNINVSGCEFELDVVTMRGYQLFAFSCKALSEDGKGGRKELKLALFEAAVRARQLGGDEAGVALVCCAEDPAGLEEEISQGIGKGRIKVFGRKHLADLDDYIKLWIESQKGEE